MGPADRARQLWLVRTAFATPSSDAGEAEVPTFLSHRVPLEADSPIGLASAIGARLMDAAIESGSRLTWLGELGSGAVRLSVGPVGPDLYAGLSGIALFLAALGRITGDRRAESGARRAFRTVCDQAAARRGAMGPGGFTGWGGVIHALAHGSVWLDDPALARQGSNLAEGLSAEIDADTQYDVVGGAAGGLLGLLALHDITGSAPVLAMARRCGDRLLATARTFGSGAAWVVPATSSEPLAGLSHGAAGVALALLRLAGRTGTAAYREMAVAALRYERSLYDDAAGGWRDLRPATGNGGFTTAWCHGAPGIGLARLATLDQLDDAEVREEIARAVAATFREGFAMNHSLCHGALGNLELPVMAATRFGRSDWARAGAAALVQITRDLSTRGPLCGSLAGLETPGFMTGLAGIGYGLLRLAEPNVVPSILTLDAPPARMAS
jgi:type 2 lantibiotic biosynthesis protein LanM